jgi:hypothetical protein
LADGLRQHRGNMTANIYSVLAALIVALPGLLAWWEAHKVRQDVAGVHKLVNSGLTQLVASTERAANAEGQAKGLAQGRAENKGETK